MHVSIKRICIHVYAICMCMYLYVHVCIGVEARLREVSRQLSLSELAREKVSSELEVLKLQAQDGQQWETEKQVIVYFSHTPCACIAARCPSPIRKETRELSWHVYMKIINSVCYIM